MPPNFSFLVFYHLLPVSGRPMAADTVGGCEMESFCYGADSIWTAKTTSGRARLLSLSCRKRTTFSSYSAGV